MAETRSEEEEAALPAKRKPDLTCPSTDEDPPAKAPKTGDRGDRINGDSRADDGADTEPVEVNGDDNAGEAADASARSGPDLEEDELEEVLEYEVDDEEEEEDDEDYGDEEDDEADGERSVDVKGKGVLKDDKGKGKLIAEEEEDDDDDSDGSNGADPSDSSDGEAQSGSDSDLLDDPLAEVDLDNILPSRTRQRRARPGVFISDDGSNAGRSDGGNSA